MKDDSERGPVGIWLREEGLKRGWKTAAERRRGLDAAGIRVDQSTYASLESGTLCQSPKLDAIRTFYKSEPPRAGTGDPLVEAITALVEEMRLSRVQQTESTDAILRAIAATIGAPMPPGTSADSGREALAGTPR